MTELQFTIYTKTLLFLSALLSLQGYLFSNLLPALTGTLLLVFLVYTKNSFKESKREITVNRRILEKLRFANHPVNIKTVVRNNGGLLKIKATDVLPENTVIVKGDNRVEQLVKHGDDISIEYQIKFTGRGNHSFNNIDLELSDRWNLYNFKTRQIEKTVVMVHSDPEEIKKAKRASSREHIEITMSSLIGTETIYEMEGIRDYVPGDRLKDIEWKATSRLQKLMTKLFQKKEVVETTILLDCSRSMRRTLEEKSKIDHATNLAIHLTKILQSIRHPVGLVAYDEFKTIKNVDPTNNYKKIFEELTDLPGQIKTSEYKTKKHVETLEVKNDNPLENQRFISTVFPFLAQGKRVIRHPMQASGIYEAIRLRLMDNKSKHLVIITDMETNIQSLYSSMNLAHARKYKIWLLALFSPYYNLSKQELTPEQLEDIYKMHNAQEKVLLKLKKLNIEIVELTPSMEGGRVIEKIRRKTS